MLAYAKINYKEKNLLLAVREMSVFWIYNHFPLGVCVMDEMEGENSSTYLKNYCA